MTIKRDDYMAGNFTHEEYYSQFVSPATIAAVVKGIGMQKILESTDKHLNDIPLQFWNCLSLPVAGSLAEAGQTYTKSTHVCIGKQAAHMFKRDSQGV